MSKLIIAMLTVLITHKILLKFKVPLFRFSNYVQGPSKYINMPRIVGGAYCLCNVLINLYETGTR